MEERAGQRCVGPQFTCVDRREHLRVFGADEREHGFAGYHGQACEHAVCNDEQVFFLSLLR